MNRLTHRNENGEAAVWVYADPENQADVIKARVRTERQALEKLAEYEDAEEQGLLLKLPCSIGSTVYELQKIRHRIQPLVITGVYTDINGNLHYYWELKDWRGIYNNVNGFDAHQLGKTVFLTREAAEEALEEE